VRPVGVQARSIAKIWVGAGRQDEVGPNDLVGLLVNELHVERTHIGKIELRDSFCLIEVPAEDAERIAQAMAGRTVRKKRLTARVDRKPAGGGSKRPPRRA
jgi:ATP-dependent RNA helicase DeaD